MPPCNLQKFCLFCFYKDKDVVLFINKDKIYILSYKWRGKDDNIFNVKNNLYFVFAAYHSDKTFYVNLNSKIKSSLVLILTGTKCPTIICYKNNHKTVE